jgi:hypothetical protein
MHACSDGSNSKELIQIRFVKWTRLSAGASMFPCKVPSLSTSFMLVLTAISMFTIGRAPGPPRLRTRDLEIQVTVNGHNIEADA